MLEYVDLSITHEKAIIIVNYISDRRVNYFILINYLIISSLFTLDLIEKLK
jgi:hypothetical protein